MLEAGANPEAPSETKGRIKVDSIKPHANSIKPLAHAVRSNSDTVVKALIKKGADLNSVDHEGRTPLEAAVYYGKDKAFGALLEAGADPFKQNEKGVAPFDILCDSVTPEGSKVVFVKHAEATMKAHGLDDGECKHRVEVLKKKMGLKSQLKSNMLMSVLKSVGKKFGVETSHEKTMQQMKSQLTARADGIVQANVNNRNKKEVHTL